MAKTPTPVPAPESVPDSFQITERQLGRLSGLNDRLLMAQRDNDDEALRSLAQQLTSILGEILATAQTT